MNTAVMTDPVEAPEEIRLRLALPAAFMSLAVMLTPTFRLQADLAHEREHEIMALLGRMDCNEAHRHGHGSSPPLPSAPTPAPCCGGKAGAVIVRRTGLKPAANVPT